MNGFGYHRWRQLPCMAMFAAAIGCAGAEELPERASAPRTPAPLKPISAQLLRELQSDEPLPAPSSLRAEPSLVRAQSVLKTLRADLTRTKLRPFVIRIAGVQDDAESPLISLSAAVLKADSKFGTPKQQTFLIPRGIQCQSGTEFRAGQVWLLFAQPQAAAGAPVVVSSVVKGGSFPGALQLEAAPGGRLKLHATAERWTAGEATDVYALVASEESKP